MKDRKLKNIPASIHRRLLNLAHEGSRPFNELVQYYAIERFLYRFSQTPHAEHFVLKGAQMLRVWAERLTRPTMDIDMMGRAENSIDNLVRIVRDCLEVECENDGITFDAESIRADEIIKDSKYHGVRVIVRGTIGTIQLRVQIDFGFGDKVVPGPTWVELSDTLNMGVPRLLGYSPESSIAEKFQAMVSLDIINTRIKDFYDIWTLSHERSFNGEILKKAIIATFERRKTELPKEIPLALSDAFSQEPDKEKLWRAFLRKGRLSAEGKSLAEVVKELEHFLMPPTLAAANKHDFTLTWSDGNWK